MGSIWPWIWFRKWIGRRSKKKKDRRWRRFWRRILIGRCSVVLFFPLRDKLHENVSKSKGVVHMTPGHFSSSASPLRLSLMALYSFTCYHQKILFRLSHTGTSSPRLLCRSQNFILPRDLVTVSYKRRMTTRFGRNWLLDGLVCVARKSSFSESKTVSFSNPRAQACDSFSSVVMRNTNWRLPFVVNVNLRVLNIWCGDCYVKIVLINRLLFSTEEDEVYETKNQDTVKRTIKVKSRGSINS